MLPAAASLAPRLALTGALAWAAVALGPWPRAVADRPWIPAAAALMVTAAAVVAWHVLARPRNQAASARLPPRVGRAYERDLYARLVVDRRGFLFAPRVLVCGSGLPWTHLPGLPRGFADRFERPVVVVTRRGSTWWAVGNEFYRTSAGQRAESVQAVVDALRWRRKARLEVPQQGGSGPEGAAARRERILADCRPNLSRHNGVVCVRCRGVIDVRDAPLAPAWTEGGVRVADLRVTCRTCGGPASRSV